MRKRLDTTDDYFQAVKDEQAGKGHILHNINGRDTFSDANDVIGWVMKGDLGLVLKELRGDVWNTLGGDLHLRLAESVLKEPGNKQRIERVEADLRKHGLGWNQLNSIREVDEGRLMRAEYYLLKADELDRKRNNKLKSLRPPLKFVGSADAFAKVEKWQKLHSMSSASLRAQATPLLHKMAGRRSDLLCRRGTNKPTVHGLFIAILVQLVDELQDAKFSEYKSLKLTDDILHALFPWRWTCQRYALNVKEAYRYYTKTRPHTSN